MIRIEHQRSNKTLSNIMSTESGFVQGSKFKEEVKV